VAKRSGSETLAVNIYEQLRAEILNGRLAPGERLKPQDLRRHFGVSLGVLREALGLLAAQNLVRIDRNRGFQVTPLSVRELHDLTTARKVVEGAALRMSVELGGVAWESEILAAHHRMAKLPEFLPDDPPARNEEWWRAHMEFHYKLVEACANPLLLDVCARLSDAAELYRSWSGPGALEARRDVAAEHKALLDAALAHRADEAVALFEAHVDRTQAILLQSRTDFADRRQSA
jgi:DNA-binding GntR family transcriptional regulator